MKFFYSQRFGLTFPKAPLKNEGKLDAVNKDCQEENHKNIMSGDTNSSDLKKITSHNFLRKSNAE